jgi:hypothetical protein
MWSRKGPINMGPETLHKNVEVEKGMENHNFI